MYQNNFNVLVNVCSKKVFKFNPLFFIMDNFEAQSAFLCNVHLIKNWIKLLELGYEHVVFSHTIRRRNIYHFLRISNAVSGQFKFGVAILEHICKF